MINFNVQSSDKKALIIFDGNCGICSGLKTYFSGLDTHKKLKFVAYQDEKLKKYTNISEELTSNSIYVITSDKQIYKGAQAILVSSLYLDNKFSLLAIILLKINIYLLLEPFYKIIARYRTKISSIFGYNACDIYLKK